MMMMNWKSKVLKFNPIHVLQYICICVNVGVCIVQLLFVVVVAAAAAAAVH